MQYISLPEARVGENVCDHRCVSTGQLLLWQRATETPPTKNTAFLVPSQKTAKSCGRRPALMAPWAKKKNRLPHISLDFERYTPKPIPVSMLLSRLSIA